MYRILGPFTRVGSSGLFHPCKMPVADFVLVGNHIVVIAAVCLHAYLEIGLDLLTGCVRTHGTALIVTGVMECNSLAARVEKHHDNLPRDLLVMPVESITAERHAEVSRGNCSVEHGYEKNACDCRRGNFERKAHSGNSSGRCMELLLSLRKRIAHRVTTNRDSAMVPLCSICMK